MRYKFYNNSEKSWRAMFDSISGARESVYLEMYIFTDDMDKYDFLKLLKEKAKNGVRVRIILDSLGSNDLSDEALSSLRSVGVEVFFISHFFHHAHRKILVIDESFAFIGGVNFTKHSSRWDDLVLAVRGKLVKNIIRSFAKVYVECGGKDPKILEQNKLIMLDKTRTWLIEHFPFKRKSSLKKIYKQYIGQAKESLTIVTPYFAPSRSLIAHLHQAVIRGVRVEVLVPENTDHFVIVDKSNYFFISKVSKLGVHFYIEPRMNHAKAMIIDGREAIVGSQNFDFLSFDYNDEIGVVLKDKRAIKSLMDIVKRWKGESKLFSPKTHRPSYFYFLLSPLIRIFARIV